MYKYIVISACCNLHIQKHIKGAKYKKTPNNFGMKNICDHIIYAHPSGGEGKDVTVIEKIHCKSSCFQTHSLRIILLFQC